jgi:hypothetical protein
MRNRTCGTVFDAAFCISEPAAAAFSQHVQRTIAEEAVELVGVNALVTRKVFAFCISEKMFVTHIFQYYNKSYDLSIKKRDAARPVSKFYDIPKLIERASFTCCIVIPSI